jgi:type VI secretion system protein ImpA
MRERLPAMISTEELLHPISETAPCGEDPSYDAALQELETMARGKPETQFSAAEPPDWKEVATIGLNLFARSKDLRIALVLMVAWIELERLPGFRGGLSLMAGLLKTFWATVHPQLDPTDNNDPLQRMNIVASLAVPVGTFGDPYRVLERLRAVPLTNSVQMGQLTWSDLLAADSAGQSGTTTVQYTPGQMDAALRDSSQEFLTLNYQAASDSLAVAKDLDGYLTGIVGPGDAPDLSPLIEELAALQKRIAPYLKATAGPKLEGSGLAATGGSTSLAVGAPATLKLSGEVQSREEVLRLLDRISQYYIRYEPSSPVPLILKRAARLVAMDFMQIISDLTPESITQIRNITGEPAEPAE